MSGSASGGPPDPPLIDSVDSGRPHRSFQIVDGRTETEIVTRVVLGPSWRLLGRRNRPNLNETATKVMRQIERLVPLPSAVVEAKKIDR